jgi:hypothetical protein
MTIASSSLTGTNQVASLGLINGTGTVQSTTTPQEILAQSQGSDSTSISKGGQLMNQLSQMATSDPSEFKATAQSISDQLATAAKSATNSKEASMLTKMSENFASAAKTGDMSSLKPQSPPSGSQGMSGLSGKSSHFGAMGADDMSAAFSTVNNIISGAVSAATSSSASTSSGVSSASSSTSTEA